MRYFMGLVVAPDMFMHTRITHIKVRSIISVLEDRRYKKSHAKKHKLKLSIIIIEV